MPQLPPGAKLLPQVLVWEKSAGSAPPIAMLVMVMAVLPKLVMVVVCGALLVPTPVEAKVRLAGLNFTAVPLPLRAAVCVPPASTTDNVADCVRSAVGLNVTEMVQLAPAPRDEPQVLLLMGNSEGSAPVIVMLEMVTVELPELVRVAVLGWLVVPITTTPQVKLVGERLTVDAPYAGASKTLIAISSESARKAKRRFFDMDCSSQGHFNFEDGICVDGKQIEACRIIGVCGARTDICSRPFLYTRLGLLRVLPRGENLNFKAHSWVVSNEFHSGGLTGRGV
jgi:hypothetical protein